MASLEELTTPVTTDEMKQSIYDVLAAIGVRTTSWKPGAVVRTIIASSAIIMAASTKLIALIAKSGFVELAEGDWLKAVARYVYGIDPATLEDTFATGQVTLTNAGGNEYDFDAMDLVVLNAARTKTYRNLAAFHLGASSNVTIDILATEAGSGSTADPGTITEFETPINGVTVTNAAAVVGIDAASDPDIRTLCYEKTQSLSPNGPSDAYAFVARTAKRTDGTLIGITKVLVSKSSVTRQVTVTLATQSGEVPELDLARVNTLIQQNVVPDGVTAIVQSATPSQWTLSYEVWLLNTTGLKDTEIKGRIETRLSELNSSVPIGGHFPGIVYDDVEYGAIYLTAIIAAIGSATTASGARLPIFRVEIPGMLGDYTFGPSACPVFIGVQAATVHQVVP